MERVKRRMPQQVILATVCYALFVGVSAPQVQSGRLPRYGGNLRIELNDIPTDLSPHRLSGDVGQLVGSSLYEGLTQFSRRGIVAGLAATWVKSKDAKRWVFRLRPGVSFHDGSPCDAAAVVASLNRLVKAEASPHQWLLQEVDGWAEFDRGEAASIEGILAVGDQEVEFHLRVPVADLDVRLALPQAAIAHRTGQNMVGTGPFRVVSGNTETLRLVAFEAYWRGRPYLDGLDLVLNSEAEVTPWASDASMKRVLPGAVETTDARRVLTRSQRLGFALVHPGSRALGTRRARLRAGAGFDRAVFAKASLNDQGEAAYGLLPGQRDLPDAASKDVEGDLMQQPRQSLRILVRAGEPVLERLGERLQVHLFASGFDAQFRAMQTDEYNVALLTEDFDIVLLGWTPPLSAGRRLQEDSLVRHVLTYVLEPALLDRLPKAWGNILRAQAPATRQALFDDGYLIPLIRFHETWEISKQISNAKPGASTADLGLLQAHLRPQP